MPYAAGELCRVFFYNIVCGGSAPAVNNGF